MTDTQREEKREDDSDIEELAVRLGTLSLTPAPTPSLVVSEPSLTLN